MTLILQQYVGEITVYRNSLTPKKLIEHKSILNNELPKGITTWEQMGANGCNIRILTIYFAEKLHNTLGLSLALIYKLIDTVFLFLCFLACFIYLSKWFDYSYCLIGVLFTGVVFIMTYHVYYFHPWDRISLFTWIVLMILLRDKKTICMGLLLVFSMFIKYDVVVFPIFYLIYNYTPKEKFRILLKTSLLFVLTFGIYKILILMFPTPFNINEQFTSVDIFYKMAAGIIKNFDRILEVHILYPPLLMFFIPILLSVLHWKEKDKFMKSAVIFSIHFVSVNFREVRAETMMLVLLLPAALFSLNRLLGKPRL